MRSRVALVALPVLAALMALLPACETVVDVEPPAHDPALVPAGFFTPDSAWVVRVSRSVAFTDTTRPAYVDSATVEVWSRGKRVARLPQVRPGTYAATGRGAQPGRTYTLRVSAEGFPDVEAQDALPHPPPVAALRDTLVEGGPDVPERRRTLRARLVIDDPPEESYYGLQIYQLRVLEDRQTGTLQLLNPSLFPFQSEDDDLGESPLSGVIDSDLSRYQEAFFTDEPFNGERRALEFQLEYDAPSPGTDRRIRRAFVALFISGSEDFYRYWETAGEQLTTGQNPFAEPLRVHSNASGGLGIFAGFRYRLIPLGGGVLEGRGMIGAGRLCEAARRAGTRLPVVCEALSR